MRPASRLRSAADFERVRRAGRSVARPEAVVYYSPRVGGESRVGFVVGRRLGGAVHRNRTKRLLREAFRRTIPVIAAPTDIVFVAREALRDASSTQVGAIVSDLLIQAGLLDAHQGEGTDR